MRIFIASLVCLLASGLLHQSISTAQETGSHNSKSLRKKTPDITPEETLPPELLNFSGMLIGKLVSRDIERGSFSVTVDYVARVWQNNKASRPRTAVGRTLKVTGVTGKWLDQLLLIRPGDSIEFEAQHREGNTFRFPGEWLKKVPPFDAAKHPVPPDGFRGFSGEILGRVLEKRIESRELVLLVNEARAAKEKNKAKNVKSVIGKKLLLAGFWANMSQPFDLIEKGDTIRAGVFHRVPQSDHFNVSKYAEKVDADSTKSPSSLKSIPDGMQGFRGILLGKLVSRDIEQGTLKFQAEKATRVWKKNAATDLNSAKGKTFLVKGITGKWLDVLISLKPGDTIEVEAFHNGAEHLDFVREHLKKID